MRSASRRATASLCVFLSLAVCGIASAGDIVDLESETAQRWLGDRYYGVFRGEARVGWLRRSLLRETFEEQAMVVRRVESFVDVAGDGNAVRSEERVVYQAEGEQLLVEIERATTKHGVRSSRRATRSGGRFDVVTIRDGKEIEGAVNAIAISLANELILERLVVAAAAKDDGPENATATSRGLDLGSMRATSRTLVVRGTEDISPADAKEAGVRIEGTAYLVSAKLPDGRLSDPMLVGGDGAILRGAMGAGLALRRMSEAAATSEKGRTSIEVSLRVPMDGKIGDPATLTELVVSLPQADADAPLPFPVTGRQSVEMVDGRFVLRVRPVLDAGAVTDAERTAALGASAGIDPEDASIVSAANNVLVGTSRRASQVVRLLRFTAAHLENAVILDEPSAAEILVGRRGDCSEHARLFVALARASGIPAREVPGLVWLGDDQRAFGWHAWAEVELLGRWRPVDPSNGVLPPHAGHLRVDQAARKAGVLDDVRLQLEKAIR